MSLLVARCARVCLVALTLIQWPLDAGAQGLRLVWGGDAEGGAPFVEADSQRPDRLVGFDVEIAELIAAALGRTPVFRQVSFASLDQSALRGDFDIGLSGVEDTPARRATVGASVPYYRFTEVLTVRVADRDRFRTLADLRGRRVATLGATIAHELLLQGEREHGITAVSYDDDVHPYGDVLNGRVDAVLLDNVLAERATQRQPGLFTQPVAVATGHYIVITAPQNTALVQAVDDTLRAAMQDGRLEAIFRRWNVWNAEQPALYAAVLSAAARGPRGGGLDAASIPDAISQAPRPSVAELTARYLPTLLQAAAVTLLLSCLAMLLAVTLGAAIATGRVYGHRLLRTMLTTYVEVVRGTPLLLQLFVIYYGLAEIIRLPAFAAALLALGGNYAAYESEIYRGALQAVPRGQLEAGRVLGFSELQLLRLVRGPQALTLALPAMTNDFVALLKDSSLVSVITVVELTKQTQIFATNLGSWLVPGLLCALLYLLLSLPLARLSRRLEARLAGPQH